MEQETFVSGYCRAADQSRMVAVVTENGVLAEVDCGFPDCPYAPGCPVAEKIKDLIK
jgi:hypothetical protein